MYKAQVYTRYMDRCMAYLWLWKLEFHRGGGQLGKDRLKRFLGDNNDNKVKTQGSSQTSICDSMQSAHLLAPSPRKPTLLFQMPIKEKPKLKCHLFQEAFPDPFSRK